MFELAIPVLQKSLLVAAVILPSLEPFASSRPQAQGLELWNKNCLKAYKKWKTLAPP